MDGTRSLKENFSGEKLYGDDFSANELEAWFADEREGYANAVLREASSYKYRHHALNVRHGFRHLPDREYKNALGLGSAYGEEFRPIVNRIKRLTIVEPSDVFTRREVCGIPATYVKLESSGVLPFYNNSFDLIICFGVLHHIANVSFVLGEICRCLEPWGFALIREPIVSMGDWTKPRGNLTKRERGIPVQLFREMIAGPGFEMMKETFCVSPLVRRLWGLFNKYAYNSIVAMSLDEILSQILKRNLRYHRTSLIQKMKPACVFYVLKKT